MGCWSAQQLAQRATLARCNCRCAAGPCGGGARFGWKSPCCCRCVVIFFRFFFVFFRFRSPLFRCCTYSSFRSGRSGRLTSNKQHADFSSVPPVRRPSGKPPKIVLVASTVFVHQSQLLTDTRKPRQIPTHQRELSPTKQANANK